MTNWQLALVILTSVLVGALIPLIVVTAISVYRVGREIGEVGVQLRRTLTQCAVISDRVEMLSRGFKGGETNIAELLASAGRLARGLDRNMKFIDVLSTIIASVGTAVATFVSSRFPLKNIEKPLTSDEGMKVPESSTAPSASAVSPSRKPIAENEAA